MIPKTIFELLIKDGLIAASEQCENPLLIKKSAISNERLDAVYSWIKNNQEIDEVKEWLTFLNSSKTDFGMIREKMGYWNPKKSHKLGHDQWSVGWAGDAMLPFAAYIYTLNSYNSDGVILECGAFKGSSTACLSILCEKLDYKLICADSFEGLPENEGHYGKGDFFGGLEEVQKNVEICGYPEHVQYLKGWYSNTLKSYSDPISFLWVDVDLQQSTLDVLKNIYKNLKSPFIIFSDGFTVDIDFDKDNQIVYTGGEAAGFYRYFKDEKISYQAVPGWSKGLAIIQPTENSDERIFFDSGFFQKLISLL